VVNECSSSTGGSSRHAKAPASYKTPAEGRRHEARRRTSRVGILGWGWAWWHEGGRARGEHEGGCVVTGSVLWGSVLWPPAARNINTQQQQLAAAPHKGAAQQVIVNCKRVTHVAKV